MQKDSRVKDQYRKFLSTLPENIQLVAVSKTYPPETVMEVYEEGQRVFGENKVQELCEKYEQLPKDISWHLIGHLQRNKVKYIAGFVDTIQTVDSEKILQEISKQAVKNERIIKVLLQLKIAEEESKFGLQIHEAKEIFQEYVAGKFPNVEITGLMGMATFTENEKQIQKEFMLLKQVFDKLTLQKKLTTLSMGMSSDYKIAIECGGNSIRVGSAIFGARNYSD